MLSNNHTITLYINNKQADTYDQNLGIRLNNVLNDPTQIIPALGDYSFTFNLPVTTTNANIFDFANIAEKKNKFNNKYEAQLIVDGITIFSGNLKLQSATPHSFSCNLYNNKQNQTEEIFQDSKLNEFDWYVPFDGIDTINDVNKNQDTDYYFPLVCYHPFNKYPYTTTASGYDKYTPKNTIDNYNKWHYTDFLPSLKLSSLLSKIYESKGYTLKGDILEDKVLNNLYLSTNIDSKQDILYNYGNDNIGKCKIHLKYNNKKSDNTIETPETYYTATHQELSQYSSNDYYAYNLFKYSQTKDILENNSEMITDDGIIIPTSGYYEIECDMTIGVANSQYDMKVYTYGVDNEYSYVQYSPNSMPVEFQLLKYSQSDKENDISHNPIGKGYYPNEYVPEEIITQGKYNIYPKEYITNRFSTNSTTLVDYYNNPNFILGMSYNLDKQALAYAKNGTSWYDEKEYNKSVYTLNNSYYLYNNKTKQKQLYTEYDNTLLNSQEQKTKKTDRQLKGKAHIIIYLEKNTILLPFINTKHYYSPEDPKDDETRGGITYNILTDCTINIRAVAPETTPITQLKGGMLSEYPTLLNLSNFINNQTLSKDFITNICNAFNLSVYIENNTVVMNKRKQYNNNNYNYITLDDRISHNSFIFNKLEYPKQQGIKYNNNNDERGIYLLGERQLTDNQLVETGWTSKISCGYDIIKLNNYSTTDNAIQLQFAYTVYDKFTLNDDIKIDIPIISKDKDFINDNDYSNITDGYSYPLRFWYRDNVTNYSLPLLNDKEYIITTPIDNKYDISLNYKDNQSNLLSYFFNLNKKMNDALEVEVYMDNQEYKDILNGCNIKVNDDIYNVMEIQGYDPEGNNKVKLTLYN